MSGLLIVLIVVFIVIVLYQVTQTLDLVNDLRSNKSTPSIKGKFNSYLFLIWGIVLVFGFFWSFGYLGKFIPPVASEHAKEINVLFDWTLWITGIVFIVTNIILFLFAFLYSEHRQKRAAHITHNNNLEAIWTIIPSIALTLLVVMGLRAWADITGPTPEDSVEFEMTGQQFFWTSRYPGADGIFGMRDYNLISPSNPLGLVSPEYIDHKLVELDKDIRSMQARELELPGLIKAAKKEVKTHPNKYHVDSVRTDLKAMQKEYREMPKHMHRRTVQFNSIVSTFNDDYFQKNAVRIQAGYDDFLPSELHLPVNMDAHVRIRALDVLHNFYLPHFTVKMDAVPGLPTQFKFKPIYTTTQMREQLSKNKLWNVIEEGESEPRYATFNYEVACAELCGTGHNSMRYVLIVEEKEDFEHWASTQTPQFELVAETLNNLDAYLTEIGMQKADFLESYKSESPEEHGEGHGAEEQEHKASLTQNHVSLR